MTSDILFLQNSLSFPTLLHFFNSDCPCSRFNLSYFRQLVKTYNKDVQFVVVLQGSTASYPLADFERYDLPVRLVHDDKEQIANQLGVYATPQAVIILEDKLYYRGNYNRARYCTLPGTNFTEIALKQAILGYPLPLLDPKAFITYGCQLPTQQNQTEEGFFSIFMGDSQQPLRQNRKKAICLPH